MIVVTARTAGEPIAVKTEARRVAKSVVVPAVVVVVVPAVAVVIAVVSVAVTVVVTVVMVAGQMTGIRKKSDHHHPQESAPLNPIHKANSFVAASERISAGRSQQWKDVSLTDG